MGGAYTLEASGIQQPERSITEEYDNIDDTANNIGIC